MNVNFKAPAKLSMKEFQTSARDWEFLPTEQYRYDESTCTFIVSVNPNEALLVDYTYNYRGSLPENRGGHFHLETLSIKGVSGAVILEGKQTESYFREDGSGDYVITYE